MKPLLRHSCGIAASRGFGQRGFSLLEVVLSLSIFFASLAVLSQISWNGTRAAVQSRLRAQAMFRCETKMQEVIAGIEPLSDQANVAFSDDGTWNWSLTTAAATNYPELLLVELSVSRQVEGGLGSVSYKLQRWIRDPEVFVAAAEAAAEAASSVTTESSSGSSQ